MARFEARRPLAWTRAATPAAYVDYEADCRTHGETSVARGRRFAEELRKLGLDVRERGNRKRFEVQGVALSSQASGSGLRLAYSR
jgi:hypothetical protein